MLFFSIHFHVFLVFFFLWEYCFFLLMGIYLALTDFVGVFHSLQLFSTQGLQLGIGFLEKRFLFVEKRKSSLLSFLSFECYKASGSNTCMVVVPLFLSLLYTLSCPSVLGCWENEGKGKKKIMCILITSDQAQLLH